MYRALLYGVASGLVDLLRSRLLVSVTVVTVGLATLFTTSVAALSELVDVGSAKAIEGSEVIVYLAENVERFETVEDELGTLPGVDLIRPATSGDLASTERGYVIGTDLSSVRTLVLNGTVTQEVVTFSAQAISGVHNSEPGLGIRVGWAIEALRILVPWLSVLFGLAGLALILNVAIAFGRIRRQEAEVMRLLGAGWPQIWASLGMVVALPVLTTTVVVSLSWPSVLEYFVSSRANELVPRSGILGAGILTAVFGVMASLAGVVVGFVSARD